MERRLQEATRRRNEAEAKLQAKKREAEARLTAVCNSQRQHIERLNFEIQSKRSELIEIEGQLARWRSQWEGEVEEKSSVGAELLSLRSEFEKSSAAYDAQIDQLKAQLEAQRRLTSEMRERWEEGVTRKNALSGQLEESERERERLASEGKAEERTAASEGARLKEAESGVERWAAKLEDAVRQQRELEGRVAKLREELHGGSAQASGALSDARGEVGEARLAITLGEQAEASTREIEREIDGLQADREAVETFAASQRQAQTHTSREMQQTLQQLREQAEAVRKVSVLGGRESGDGGRGERRGCTCRV